MPEEKARCSPALGRPTSNRCGFVEHLGVAVGPAEERHHRLPRGHPHARHLGVALRDAARCAARGSRTAAPRRRRSARARARRAAGRAGPGARSSRRRAVADEVDRGLEARREQQHRGGRAARRWVSLPSAACACTSVERMSSPGWARRCAKWPSIHRCNARSAPLGAAELAQREPGVERARRLRPPREELAAHRDRRAEHLRDDRGGEQAGVLGHQVDVATAFEAGEQLVGDLLGAAAQRGHGPCGERAGDELAVAGVVGLVDGQHRGRLDRPERPAPADGLREEQPARHVAGVAADDAEVGAAQHRRRDRVRDGGDREAVVVERAFGAEGLVVRERVERVGRVDHERGRDLARPRPPRGRPPDQPVPHTPPEELAHAANLLPVTYGVVGVSR